MKTFLIVLSGHEMNSSYIINGKSLRDAIESNCREGGAFEWCIESEMNSNDIYNWIKNNEGAEETRVYEIEGSIKELTL